MTVRNQSQNDCQKSKTKLVLQKLQAGKSQNSSERNRDIMKKMHEMRKIVWGKSYVDGDVELIAIEERKK